MPKEKQDEYRIVHCRNLTALATKVNKVMADWWEPLGGPFYYPYNNGYAQAMILRHGEID